MRPCRVGVALAATGCLQVTHTPVCLLDPDPIGDDEVTDLGYAPDDLLALAQGTHVESAEWFDGSGAELTIDVARASGSAEYVVSTDGEETSRSWGFGHNYLDIAVICGDFVRVPVDLSFTDADGDLDVSGASALISADNADLTTAGLARPFDDVTAPDPPGIDLDEWTDQEAVASVTFDTQGTSGNVSWTGERTTEDSAMATSEELVFWPAL